MLGVSHLRSRAISTIFCFDCPSIWLMRKRAADNSDSNFRISASNLVSISQRNTGNDGQRKAAGAWDCVEEMNHELVEAA
jgi:hypothetical protein